MPSTVVDLFTVTDISWIVVIKTNDDILDKLSDRLESLGKVSKASCLSKVPQPISTCNSTLSKSLTPWPNSGTALEGGRCEGVGKQRREFELAKTIFVGGATDNNV